MRPNEGTLPIYSSDILKILLEVLILQILAIRQPYSVDAQFSHGLRYCLCYFGEQMQMIMAIDMTWSSLEHLHKSLHLPSKLIANRLLIRIDLAFLLKLSFMHHSAFSHEEAQWFSSRQIKVQAYGSFLEDMWMRSLQGHYFLCSRE